MNFFEKANYMYNLQDYKKALSLYEKAMLSKDNEVAALYNSAVCFIKLKDFRKAIPLLKIALSRKVDSRYLFNLGYCYSMIRDNRKALQYFNNAWALDNNDSDCEKAISLLLKSYKPT